MMVHGMVASWGDARVSSAVDLSVVMSETKALKMVVMMANLLVVD